jgi:hypothetical protein
VVAVLRFLVFLALFVTSLLAPSAASASAPVCRGPEGASFVGCLGAAPVSSRSLEASFDTAGERADVGDTVRSLTIEAPARRAGTGLIAAIWAMTLLGFGTVAVLLRREVAAPDGPAR